MNDRLDEQAKLNEQVKRESGKRTRRSFLVAAAAAVGGYEFYRWIDTSNGDQRVPRPLRKGLNFNAKVSKGVFDDRGLSPTYPVSKAVPLRTNGDYGLKTLIAPENYRRLVTLGGAEDRQEAHGVSSSWCRSRRWRSRKPPRARASPAPHRPHEHVE